MANIVTLVCLVFGEASGNAFPVEIRKNSNVGDLKNAIKGKVPAFVGIDAHRLNLWGVSIPNDDEKALQSLTLEDGCWGTIQKLRPPKKIRHVFTEPPVDGHIHIIIEPPTSTGKLEAHFSSPIYLSVALNSAVVSQKFTGFPQTFDVLVKPQRERLRWAVYIGQATLNDLKHAIWAANPEIEITDVTTITLTTTDGVKCVTTNDSELRMRLTILAAQQSHTITVHLETRT